MEQIASQACVDFLLKAIETIDARPSRKHQPEFPEDPDALMQALGALGTIGGGEIEARLDRFVNRWSSPFWRWFNRPLKGLVSFQEVLKAARSALALSRRKIRPATATATATAP